MSGLLVAVLVPLALGASAKRPAKAKAVAAGSGKLAAIAPAVEEAVRMHECPGAVVEIGHNGRVVYRRAFGHRALEPRRLPMTVSTIFDMASLTKVIATTTAAMQLVEQGKLRLEDPVAKYWPEFGANGKDQITVRELMTHYSGLQPDLELEPAWSGYDTAMKLIVAASPMWPPGTRFVYSDVNYETMGELVRRISGEPLDVYCARHIFKPLGMKDTMFRPPARLRWRIAPTQHENGASGPILWGVVHDPTSRDMGGVAGHAGLFSDASDLAIFCQMLLNGGSYHGRRILSPLSALKIAAPQSPPGKTAVRGLGWDIDSPFSSNRGELFPIGSFGHTGFTGTSIWIDPFSKTYVIILTNSVHPNGEGNVVPLRARIATIAAAAYGRAPTPSELAAREVVTGYQELLNSYPQPEPPKPDLETGLDVLESQNFAPLAGLRVGLVTNQTGVDRSGHRAIDLLAHAPNVKLLALFSPEHGLYGTKDERVPSSTEPITGLPVYSLYGETDRPTDQMLQGIDALVYDLQDAGVRFYTYVTTLGYTLEAAARRHIPVFVLDRPDPITGALVEGPMLDADLRSFVAYYPVPVRPGMTVGELATMFNQEEKLGVDLRVIRMKNWQRREWYDQTGLAWVNPSPNLRNLTEAALYPGVGMIEGANVSVGRGTDTPFEVLGAPWINGRELAAYLNARKIQGVRFAAVDFTPRQSRFAGEVCHGVQFDLLDRDALDAPEMGTELAAALYKLFPKDFKLDETLALVGSRGVLEAIRKGRDPRRLAYEWQQHDLLPFERLRARYLLY